MSAVGILWALFPSLQKVGFVCEIDGHRHFSERLWTPGTDSRSNSLTGCSVSCHLTVEVRLVSERTAQ